MSAPEVRSLLKECYADFCRVALSDAGYSIDGLDPSSLILAYYSVLHRSIEARPRKVLRAAYETPKHLLEGEKILLQKVEEGEPLRPNQSRKLEKRLYDDAMFNDWGVHHFHLGTVPDTKNSRIVRGTEEILFATVTENDFYAIGIFGHDSWTEESVLNIVHENWPELLESFVVREIIFPESNSHEGSNLPRQAGVNAVSKRYDGTIHMSPGGGVTCSGHSERILDSLMKLDRDFRHIEKNVPAEFASIGNELSELESVTFRLAKCAAGIEVFIDELPNIRFSVNFISVPKI
ncbi:hypothetical protein [Hwanghaeella sp. LZ110]|uniref:hypothetical protein n=1 Tax=Hwanghaeella sp. LZ110 TaxID=3402810 RepID=UPI003B685551